MEEGRNEVETAEMHSEDDKVPVEKNRKRTVKTRAQVQALENFYNEYKYPTESMKMELAEAIGLTEKQISGWFCHRRLKDKKLMWDNYVAVRQDRSSVLQDHGSGHRQDSCGSTQQGDDKNLDTREVESGRLTRPEHSTVEFTYERGGRYSGNNNPMDDGSSGSSSSLRSMSNHHIENHFDMATSGCLTPKFPTGMIGAKPRSGPSGYLKVKRAFENPAVTAVKRQLGNLYRDDGPPLGVEFDLLPPGSFESTQDPVAETGCIGVAVSPTSPDISKIHQPHKFGKGRECGPSMSSLSSKMDRTGFKMPQGSDVLDTYGQQKFKQTSPPGYYSWRSPEMSTKDLSGSDSRDDYGMRYKHGVEDARVSSVSSNGQQQLFGVKLNVEQESSFRKRKEVFRNKFQGENVDNDSSYLSMKGFEYQCPAGKMKPRQIAKGGKIYAGRNTNGNQIEIPYRSDITVSKRNWDGIPQHQPILKKPLVVANHAGTSRAIRSAAEMQGRCSDEDAESAETSYSVE